MHRVSQAESHRLKLRDVDNPGRVQEGDSTGINKIDINTYIERVHRKFPFALREAYLSCDGRRMSHSKAYEVRRRDSVIGFMYFDVDPDESIHWNFPVPLTNGTGDMTLRHMSIIVDVAHDIMQFQFDADIRVQVDETPRLRRDSRCIDSKVDADTQTESRITACAGTQTDPETGPPRFAALFSGRILSHSSICFTRVNPVSEPAGVCCTLQ